MTKQWAILEVETYDIRSLAAFLANVLSSSYINNPDEAHLCVLSYYRKKTQVTIPGNTRKLHKTSDTEGISKDVASNDTKKYPSQILTKYTYCVQIWGPIDILMKVEVLLHPINIKFRFMSEPTLQDRLTIQKNAIDLFIEDVRCHAHSAEDLDLAHDLQDKLSEQEGGAE